MEMESWKKRNQEREKWELKKKKKKRKKKKIQNVDDFQTSEFNNR